MRPDQVKRLEELAEKLADAFLLEADPAEWPGDGKPPAELTQQERGDRYWAKKNAMATGGVLRYTMDVLAKHTAPNEGNEKPEDELEDQIRKAEKQAADAMKRVLGKAKAAHGG